MFRSDVVFQLDRGGVLPLLKRPPSVRLALLVVIMILTRAMWRTGTGLYRARQRTQRDGDDDDRNHRGPRNSWFLMLHLFSFSSSHTVRLQINPQPDLLHERSYRTCFEPDNPRRRTAAPVPTPPTPPRLPGGHHQPGNVDIPAGPWWGDPVVDEDPGGRPVYLLVVVLCCVARSPDVNVIRPPPGPAPHSLCPSSTRPLRSMYTQYRPQSCDSCDDAQRSGDDLWFLKYRHTAVYLYGWLFRVHRQ